MSGLQALFDPQMAGVQPPQLTLVFEAYAGFDIEKDFNNPELLRPYEAFMQRFAQDVGGCAAGDNRPGWVRATPARLNELREWFADPKARFHDAGVAMFRGGSHKVSEPPYFDFTAYPKDQLPSTRCRIALALTDRHLADACNMVRSFFEGEFPLAAATVGFGLAHDRLAMDWLDMEHWLGHWSFRYPGLVSSGCGSQWRFIRAGGLHDVNWITVLGPTLSQRVEGLAGLRKAFETQPAIVCEPFGEGGVLIKAGNLPQLGDTMQGDAVDLYRQVGMALLKLREGIQAQNQVVPGMGREPELRGQWGNRFFGPFEPQWT